MRDRGNELVLLLDQFLEAASGLGLVCDIERNNGLVTVGRRAQRCAEAGERS